MLIKAGIIRGIIPFIIMTGLSLIMKYQGLEPFQIRSTFIVGIIIASVSAASVIYEIKSWSLFKQSTVHFLVMLITVFPCLLVSGWFQLNNALDYIKIFGIFVGIGIVLWGISYIIFGKLL